jgi:Aminopeptidase P, N-terminal domain
VVIANRGVIESIEKDLSERGYKMTMFVPAKDAQMELWNGSRSGTLGAAEIFGADEVNGGCTFAGKSLFDMC